MADFNVNHITGKQGQQGTVLAGVTTVSSTGSMRIPSGPTEHRGGRGRGFFGGGYGASSPYPELNVIDMIEVATLGNATDFGDLTIGRTANGMGCSSTRGLFAAGRYPGVNNDQSQIDYITTSSGGGANDFGDLNNLPNTSTGFSDATRAIFAGGYDARTSPYVRSYAMSYVNIATTGSSSDFGDTVEPGRRDTSFSNATRGFTTGLSTPSDSKRIEMAIIQTKGSSTDFGELTGSAGFEGNTNSWNGASSQTRGIIFSGKVSPNASRNIIEYLTLSSQGNSVNFGDQLTSSSSGGVASCGNQIRGVVRTSSGNDGNVLEYVTIATTGNATDFGDLATGRRVYSSLCDAHGGLG